MKRKHLTMFLIFDLVVLLAAAAVMADQNYIPAPLRPLLKRLATVINSLFAATWLLIPNMRLKLSR